MSTLCTARRPAASRAQRGARPSGHAAAIQDAAAVDAIPGALHTTVTAHGISQRFAGTVQPHGGVVDGDPEHLGRFRKRGVPGIDQGKHLGVCRAQPLGLDQTAVTGCFPHDGGSVHHLRGRGLDQRLPFSPLAQRIRDGIAVDAVEPGQCALGVAQRSRPLHGAHRRRLQHVFHIARGHAAAHKAPKCTGMCAQRFGDHLRLQLCGVAGHGSKASSLARAGAAAGRVAGTVGVAGALLAAAAAAAALGLRTFAGAGAGALRTGTLAVFFHNAFLGLPPEAGRPLLVLTEQDAAALQSP